MCNNIPSMLYDFTRYPQWLEWWNPTCFQIMNAWSAHVASFWIKHPTLNFKDVRKYSKSRCIPHHLYTSWVDLISQPFIQLYRRFQVSTMQQLYNFILSDNEHIKPYCNTHTQKSWNIMSNYITAKSCKWTTTTTTTTTTTKDNNNNNNNNSHSSPSHHLPLFLKCL